MPLADRCLQNFDPSVRTRGFHYYRERQVQLCDSPRNELHAVVQGGGNYQVFLDWGFSREQLAVCCTCPYYADKGFCKHIWATILAADSIGARPTGPQAAGNAGDGAGRLRRIQRRLVDRR